MIYHFKCQECGKQVERRRSQQASKPKFCSHQCRVASMRKQEPVFSREWLHQKYIVEEMGCPEIGRIVNRDAKTILYWLRKYGIETRPRGHNRDQNLPDGRPPGWNHTEDAKSKVGAASRKRGAVPYLRNGVHWLHSEPGLKPGSWKGGVTPERQAFYATKKWKRAVKAVWTRDNAQCQRCGLDARDFETGSGKFHVHHIVSFAVEALRSEPSNLILLCNDCHYWVHSSENVNGEFIDTTPDPVYTNGNGAHA